MAFQQYTDFGPASDWLEKWHITGSDTLNIKGPAGILRGPMHWLKFFHEFQHSSPDEVLDLYITLTIAKKVLTSVANVVFKELEVSTEIYGIY